MTRVRAARLLAVGAAAVCACADAQPPGSPALSVSVEQASAWTRNFNPLVPGGLARWPTRAGVYEPLAIYNAMTSEWVPWLATEWSWSGDLRKVTFRIREGVKWSDGQPFTARDVAFTFELLRAHPALDQHAVWKWVEAVRAVDDLTVEIDLVRPYVPGFDALAHQLIVPEHVWRDVDAPMQFANPSPVATGPFTEVRVFRNQVYELGANPYYWQPGVPAVPALRMSAYPSNDQAQLALIDGQVDWAGTFVPAVERTYVSRDPEHFHYWFPTVGPSVMLYPNTKREALSDRRVRKAISMAIDRKRLTAIAMEGYTKPSNGAGLSDAYASWIDPQAAESAWVSHDVDAANQLLDDAGWPRKAGGVRMRLDIHVVSGWSDWVRAAQLVSRDLRAVGIVAKVRVFEFGTWFNDVQRGDFDLAVGWTLDGPTPYRTYRWLMASDTVRPLGELAPGNWHRVGDPIADELFGELESAIDAPHQRALIASLQRRFAEIAPAIPLFPNPLWGAYSTRRFVGFPNADDPYAVLAPHGEPSSLLVLTRLRPREED